MAKGPEGKTPFFWLLHALVSQLMQQQAWPLYKEGPERKLYHERKRETDKEME